MKAIIFDMYGVILKQTGSDFVPYVQKTFPKLEPEEIYNIWFKADVGELTSLQVWERLGFQGDLEALEKEYLDTIELNDGIVEFLHFIKDKYKLAIISNDSSRWSSYLRNKFKLNDFFRVISISGDLKFQKPEKLIYQYTIQQLEIAAEECIFIDDRVDNLKTAYNLGIKTVLFDPVNKNPFGEEAASFSELKKRIQNGEW